MSPTELPDALVLIGLPTIAFELAILAPVIWWMLSANPRNDQGFGEGDPPPGPQPVPPEDMERTLREIRDLPETRADPPVRSVPR